MTEATAKLTANDGTASDFFGSSVSITDAVLDNGYAAVGAPGDDTGSAYIFTKPESSEWADTSTHAKLTPSDGSNGDNFGTSISYYGVRVAIGAPNHNSDQGAAYLFLKPRFDWADSSSETENIEGSTSASGDQFGTSVSLYNIRLLIGAPWDDDGSQDEGVGFLFTSDSPNNREQYGGGSDVPEFKDYIYILSIFIAVGLMYKVVPRLSLKKK